MPKPYTSFRLNAQSAVGLGIVRQSVANTLAMVMIGAVAFSGFLALSLTPMLCSKMLRKQERGRFTGWIDDPFQISTANGSTARSIGR